MAEAFIVQGPVSMGITSNSGGITSATVVGQATNEDQFQVRPYTELVPLTSTATGLVPAGYVYAGRYAMISGTLATLDQAILSTVLGSPKAEGSASETEGARGDIGTVLGSETGGNTPREYTLTLTPTIDSATGSLRYTFTFPRAILAPGESFSWQNMGNNQSAWFVQFIALPNSSGVIWTRAATGA